MRRLGLSSLRIRLLLLVLLAVLPAFGLILYSGLEQRRLAVMAIQEEALRLAQLASAEHARVIEGTRQLLITLAQVPAVTAGDSAACTALLAGLLRQDLRYANIGVIKPGGEVLCSALPVAAPVNLADRPYFRRALETRAFAAGEYQIGRLTGKATINFGYPVLSRTGMGKRKARRASPAAAQATASGPALSTKRSAGWRPNKVSCLSMPASTKAARQATSPRKSIRAVCREVTPAGLYDGRASCVSH